MEATPTENAENASQDEKMVNALAKTIEMASALPRKKRPKKSALFSITTSGDNALVVNQIGKIRSTRIYDKYASLLTHEVQQSSVRIAKYPQNNIVSAIIARGKILVLVGLDGLIGEGCLITAAVKAGLISEEEASEINNEWFENLRKHEIWETISA